MPFDDIRQWIAALDRAGELKRIQTEVDPVLEIAEITDRVSKSASTATTLVGTGASPVPPINHGKLHLMPPMRRIGKRPARTHVDGRAAAATADVALRR